MWLRHKNINIISINVMILCQAALKLSIVKGATQIKRTY